MASWRKTKTPGVYVAHQRCCPAYAAASARCRCEPSWRGRRRHPAHAIGCRALGVRHLRTRPYRPQTNGKAERFIRTMLAGWAYGALYRTSTERTAALDGWIHYYNHHRRHSALGHKPPITRLNERTNVLGTYT